MPAQLFLDMSLEAAMFADTAIMMDAWKAIISKIKLSKPDALIINVPAHPNVKHQHKVFMELFSQIKTGQPEHFTVISSGLPYHFTGDRRPVQCEQLGFPSIDVMVYIGPTGRVACTGTGVQEFQALMM
jgi:hypothetical protein